jgi:RND family efflux transporter MFP subunit
MYEAQKKVEELDALLAVSREITSTLDLDKVMKTVVNASAALIEYDRCAIAIMQAGKLRLGAVSGEKEVDTGDASIKRSAEMLEWLYYSGTDVAVTQEDDGTIVTDRPETQEKFKTFFADSGMRSYYGVLLKDEEGKLGALGFESQDPFVFEEESRDLLHILVNQATVAVRNAQLYQQVPLVGFLKPLAESRRKLSAIPARKGLRYAATVLAALIVLFIVPWGIRVEAPVRVVPGQRTAVVSSVEGIIKSVNHREGDSVAAGEVLAVLEDQPYQAALAEAQSALEIAESDETRHRNEGNSAAMFQARSRREELSAKIALAEEQLERTRLKAPAAGVIVTPRIDQRVGQLLTTGAEFCLLADTTDVTAEIAVPESDAGNVRAGQKVALKLNPFPTRTFNGEVTNVGAQVHEEGDDRFVIAEARMANPGTLQPGTLGRAKVSVGKKPLLVALLRKPARYFWLKIWPLLP